jgi:hypothetical protein
MFDLKRPCAACPFRKGMGKRFGLPCARLREIRRATAFQCHATVDYKAFDDDEKRQGDRPQQCAGLMTLLHRLNQPNQIMQVAERLGHLNPATLDPKHEVYATWAEAMRAHRGIEP